MKQWVRIFFPALFVVFCSLSASAEMVTCAQCGMGVDLSSKFTSKIVQAKQTLHFCDIGDLFSYLNAHSASTTEAQVKDYTSGDWINAQQAFYVQSAKKFPTPMGWGIAAFKVSNDAASYGSVMDYGSTLKAVR